MTSAAAVATNAFWVLAIFGVAIGSALTWRLTVQRRRDLVDREYVARAVAAGDPSPGLAYDVPLSYAEARSIAGCLAVLACDDWPDERVEFVHEQVDEARRQAWAYVALLRARLDAPRSVDRG